MFDTFTITTLVYHSVDKINTFRYKIRHTKRSTSNSQKFSNKSRVKDLPRNIVYPGLRRISLLRFDVLLWEVIVS